MTGPEAAYTLCRAVFFGAALFLWGAGGYLAFLVPVRLRLEIWERLKSLRRLAVAAALLCCIMNLPLKAAIIGDGWPDAVNRSMLSAVAFETAVGNAWLVQAATVLMFVAACLMQRVSAIAVAAALMLASLSLTGHAAMQDGPARLLHGANDVLHLLSVGAWIGALVPMLLILGELEGSPEARKALMRFSTAGHVAVAVALLTGIANTLFILGRLPTDWDFAYQQLLAVKIGLVAAMCLIALANRYLLVPRLVRSYGLLALRIGTVAEIVMAMVVIALVAWFGTLQPN